jgi:hypothetical protein
MSSLKMNDLIPDNVKFYPEAGEDFLSLDKGRQVKVIKALQKISRAPSQYGKPLENREDRPLRDMAGVWMCTGKGAGLSGTGLWAPPRRINVATFKHDLLVVDVGIKLEKRGKWISERELRSGRGYRKKVPDGMILCSDKKIACEVELMRKSERSIEKNVGFYTASIEYDEVWYFVPGKAVGDTIEKVVEGIDFIKVVDLREVLKDAGSVER